MLRTSDRIEKSSQISPDVIRMAQYSAQAKDAWSAYLFHPTIFTEKIQSMRSSLPETAKTYYAMKVNPHQCFLNAALQSSADGIEIASRGEGEQAITAGFSGRNLIYSGPGKSLGSLAWAVENGLKSVHIESLTEAVRLNTICQRLDRRQDVLVRVNPTFACDEAEESFGGVASKMGVDEEAVVESLPEFLSLDHLNVRGIHMYAASNVRLHETMLDMSSRVFAFIRRLEQEVAGFRAEAINLGGGFGIDYSGADNHFDMAAFGRGLADMLLKFGFGRRELILEPGRWLAAPAGWYATEILDIKMSRGQKQLICAGGANHFRRPAATFCNHPCTIIPMNREPIHSHQLSVVDETVDVSGPLCTTIDRIAHDLHLEHAEIGDVIVFSLAGAYGLSMSPSSFLSHDLPEEIVVEAGASE